MERLWGWTAMSFQSWRFSVPRKSTVLFFSYQQFVGSTFTATKLQKNINLICPNQIKFLLLNWQESNHQYIEYVSLTCNETTPSPLSNSTQFLSSYQGSFSLQFLLLHKSLNRLMASPVHYPNKMRSVMVILIFYCTLLLPTKPGEKSQFFFLNVGMSLSFIREEIPCALISIIPFLCKKKVLCQC